MRDGPFADGSCRRAAHYNAYVCVCALSDQGPGANGAAGVDDYAVDADVERGGGRKSGDDVSEGQARRLVLLRCEGEFRARPRAGPASGRETRNAQAAFDSNHSEGKRRSRGDRGTAGERFARADLSRTVR